MKRIFLILIVLFNLSCSSDDDSEESALENAKYIKSRIYTNLPSDAPNYDEFYEYQDNLLKSASGFTHLLGEYSYDSSGKLTSMFNQYEQFSYEYDENGRITKQNEIGTNNYIELFYENNRVIIHRYYEFGSTNGVPNSRLEERELLIDNQGRITKMTDLAPDQSAIDTDYEIYEYDNSGNIIKVTSKQSDEQEERVYNYTYEDIKNPYYYSLKEYYKKTYYLEFFLGLHLYNDYGLTPNLIASDDKTYETNEFNYPTTEFKQSYSDVYEIIYEYY